MSGLFLAWAAELAVMQFRTFTRGRPPAAGGGRILWPADVAATFVVFGGLGVLADTQTFSGVAPLVGWGLVLATVLNLFDPTSLAVAQKTIAARPASNLPAQRGAQA